MLRKSSIFWFFEFVEFLKNLKIANLEICFYYVEIKIFNFIKSKNWEFRKF